MKRIIFLSLFLWFFSVAGTQGGDTPPSPYSGQESRAIKSLSQDDIAELRRGGGWGLAKVAELNGMPDPAHLLELKNEIPLSADQVPAITAIFGRMRADAIAEGERLITRERALEDAFRARTVTNENLRVMLAEYRGKPIVAPPHPPRHPPEHDRSADRGPDCALQRATGIRLRRLRRRAPRA